MPEIADAFRNQKVVITGVLGFIGANLARTLVQFGAVVTLVDSLIPEYGGNPCNISDIEDKVFEVWDGLHKRDYTYVDDAASAFLLAAANDKSNGKIFNLGADTAYTLTRTADLMAQANGEWRYVTKTFPADRRCIDIGDYYANDSAIRDTLGWKPQVSLHDAFEKTLVYYRDKLDCYF